MSMSSMPSKRPVSDDEDHDEDLDDDQDMIDGDQSGSPQGFRRIYLTIIIHSTARVNNGHS
jgi:hypothetical protein